MDRYLRAVRAAGAPDRGPLASEEEVDSVAESVAPFAIPRELIEAWLRVGVTDWLIDNGEFQSPPSALQSRRMFAEPPTMPRPLFPISYASHTFLFMESRQYVELEVEVTEPRVEPDAIPIVAMFDKNSYRFRATMARPLVT